MCVGVTDGVKRSSLEAFATKPEWVIIIDSFDELDAFALDVALLVCEAVGTVGMYAAHYNCHILDNLPLIIYTLYRPLLWMRHNWCVNRSTKYSMCMYVCRRNSQLQLNEND